jgi:V-type H+-transporting ATPase subunit H
MLLDLVENVSHDKGLMAYVVPSLEAIVSENQRQFK